MAKNGHNGGQYTSGGTITTETATIVECRNVVYNVFYSIPCFSVRTVRFGIFKAY